MVFHENRLFMKWHTIFFSKIRKDVAKFVVCCSRDWRFKGETCVPLARHAYGTHYSVRIRISSSVNTFQNMLPTIRLSPLGSPVMRKYT